MIIKRFQYTINYVHILTFREEYKAAIIPYFGFDKVEYAVDNQNTVDESIRLIFRIEGFALVINKEGINFIYEGEIEDLREQNTKFKIFWDIYEKLRKFKGYLKGTKHTIIANAIVPKSVERSVILAEPLGISFNPFKSLNEYAITYESHVDDIYHKIHFGNFSNRDIQAFDLRPLQTEFTKDLEDTVGYHVKIESFKAEKEPTFSKFKSLLHNVEKTLSLFDELIRNYEFKING
ncbi:MAG: hypothetical protein JNL23_08195 [Chitinophagaceae bacterium]|nr:hypothetical protein [Chitinophagaceae bacterium]